MGSSFCVIAVLVLLTIVAWTGCLADDTHLDLSSENMRDSDNEPDSLRKLLGDKRVRRIKRSWSRSNYDRYRSSWSRSRDGSRYVRPGGSSGSDEGYRRHNSYWGSRSNGWKSNSREIYTRPGGSSSSGGRSKSRWISTRTRGSSSSDSSSGSYGVLYRQLKRHLKRLGLRRRGNNDIGCIQIAIQTEIETSGCSLGCRSMSRRLQAKHGISLGRDNVLQLQRLIDPEGLSLRRRHCLRRREYSNKGPNYLVHIDGYDKLKRFGFAIHGAICGFSRRILWLKVARTNNNPRVVASYFLDYVEEVKGVPRCLRMDAGTENGYIQNLQMAFRWEHGDEMCGENSVIIGSSHTNQRIERWWRSLRQMGMSYWIDLFDRLECEGIYSTGNSMHIECVRFCFMRLIQSELDQIKTEWNSHKVREGSNPNTLSNTPDLLFYHPELFDSYDYKYEVNTADVTALKTFCECPRAIGCTREVEDICLSLMEGSGQPHPDNPDMAVNLLHWLVQQM